MSWFDGFASHYFTFEYLIYGDIGEAQGEVYPQRYPAVGTYNTGAILCFNSLFGQTHIDCTGFADEPLNSGVVNWGMWCAPANTLGNFWNVHTVFAQLNYIDMSGDSFRSIALAITATRQLEIWVGQTVPGPSGTLVYQSADNFFDFDQPTSVAYTHVELRIDAPSGNLLLYRNGVLHTTLTGETLYVDSPVYKEVAVVMLRNFGSEGVAISDAYVVEDSPYGRVGKGRVTTILIAPVSTADVEVTGWSKTWLFPGTQEPPSYGGVLRSRFISPWGLNFPDIYGNSLITGSGRAMFAFDRCYPVGPIHGLALRATVQRVASGFTQLRGVVRDMVNGGYRYSSYQTVVAGDYQTISCLFRLNPFTGESWREEDFLSIGTVYTFGIESTDTIHCSQIAMVRLHTATDDAGPRYYANNTQVG